MPEIPEVLFPSDRHQPVDPALIAELRADLDRLALEMPNWIQFRVTKRTLSEMARCEGLYVAGEQSPWPGWSVPLARGTLLHDAASVWLMADPDLSPVDAVNATFAQRAGKDRDSLGEWLRTADPFVLADLRQAVNNAMNLFVRDLAGLQGMADIRTDQRIRVGFRNGRLQLVNAPDITVGLAEARVSIELKTGRVDGVHLAEAMFGALVETLRFGQAPDRVVLWDLTSGEGVGYDVRPDDLRATARRTIGLVKRAVNVSAGYVEPLLNPGPYCRYCPDTETCPGAVAEPVQLDGGES